MCLACEALGGTTTWGVNRACVRSVLARYPHPRKHPRHRQLTEHIPTTSSRAHELLVVWRANGAMITLLNIKRQYGMQSQQAYHTSPPFTTSYLETYPYGDLSRPRSRASDGEVFFSMTPFNTAPTEMSDRNINTFESFVCREKWTTKRGME